MPAADLPPIDPLAVLEPLARHGVDFVLIGGVAAIFHGYTLPTEDVDITPDPAPANLARLAAALREVNARLRVPGESNGVPFDVSGEALARALVWTLTTDRGDLDIVIEPDGTHGYKDLRRDATTLEIGAGLEVMVASLRDLIRSKEAAGRPKDIASLPMLRAALERQPDR